MKKVASILIVLHVFGNPFFFSFPFASAKENNYNENDSVTADAYFAEGLSRKRNGEYHQAIQFFTKVIELKPNFVPAYLNRGYCKSQMMDYNSAIDDYTQALLRSNTFEESIEAHYNRGLTLAMLDNLKAAMADFNKAIKLNPEYADAYYNRSILKGKLGDYAGELNDINKVISLRPNDFNAYNSRGIVKSMMGEYQEAEQDFMRAIELNKSFADAWFNRALIYWELKNYAMALNDFNMSIQLSPDAESYNRRGNVKIKLNDLRGAFDDYTEAIKLQPKFYMAYLNRGYLKFDLKDYESAVEDYTLALKYKPDCALAYYHRGLSKGKLSDFNGEISDYTKAIVCRPDYHEAYLKRGIAKFAIGERREGCLDLNKAMKLGNRQAYDLLVENCN